MSAQVQDFQTDGVVCRVVHPHPCAVVLVEQGVGFCLVSRIRQVVCQALRYGFLSRPAVKQHPGEVFPAHVALVEGVEGHQDEVLRAGEVVNYSAFVQVLRGEVSFSFDRQGDGLPDVERVEQAEAVGSHGRQLVPVAVVVIGAVAAAEREDPAADHENSVPFEADAEFGRIVRSNVLYYQYGTSRCKKNQF